MAADVCSGVVALERCSLAMSLQPTNPVPLCPSNPMVKTSVTSADTAFDHLSEKVKLSP
jgi:hypothetical protein